MRQMPHGALTVLHRRLPSPGPSPVPSQPLDLGLLRSGPHEAHFSTDQNPEIKSEDVQRGQLADSKRSWKTAVGMSCPHLNLANAQICQPPLSSRWCGWGGGARVGLF